MADDLELIRLKNQVKKAKVTELKLIEMVIEMAQESMPPSHYDSFTEALKHMAKNRHIELFIKE